MAAKTSMVFIKNQIKNIKINQECTPEGFDMDANKGIYFKQYKLLPKDINSSFPGKKNIYLNLYFNPQDRASYVTKQTATIEYCKKELDVIIKEKKTLNKKTYKTEYKYFNIEFYKTSDRVKSYSINQKKIDDDRLLVRYFANLEINLKLDPMEANRTYKLRDEQEKMFEGRKSRFNLERLHCSSEESLRGREFIIFIASIILSHLRNNWRTKIRDDKFLKRKYPTEIDVLDEMRSIRYIKHEGQEGYMEPFAGAQLELCKLFNLNIPEECKPSSERKPK